MILNDVVSLDNSKSIIPNNKSILNFGLNMKNIKIFTMDSTKFSKEISIIKSGITCNEIEDANLIILSEPSAEILGEVDLAAFLDEYSSLITDNQNADKKFVHIVTNYKWYVLFHEILKEYKIPVYLTNQEFSCLKEYIKDVEFHIVEDFFYVQDLHHYSNDITKNLLIDLTCLQNQENFYSHTINSIFETVEDFDDVTILVPENSYFPNIENEKINVCLESSRVQIENYTYVLVLTNTPYTDMSIKKVLYYAANSKVVFTNYNFKLNNMIPSVILNLSNKLDLVKPLTKADAFDIINENRNTIMYKYSTINLLDKIYRGFFKDSLIAPLEINNTLDHYEDNLYLRKTNNSSSNLSIVEYKYDIEKTLAFPIIFLGEKSVKYKNSLLTLVNQSQSPYIIHHYNNEITKSTTNPKVSVIVPIHNNGKYLKFKCFRSLKTLSKFNEMEIIFVDDGSSDPETLRIIEDILSNNRVVFKRYEDGSGSASRPRNEGVHLASTDLITYLDPDNETIDDGHSVLLTEMLKDDSLDMVVGDIVREDNNKRNAIRYSKKVQRAINTDVIEDTKETLVKTNLTVQSIQGLIVKKNVITDNNIIMVEGAAGQDTLYFQELLLNCSKVKVVDHMIHSYYAYVEGSVTNTVSHKFFEKFYKVEQERIKFLIKEDLIEHYMKIKFNFYFKNWYMTKYEQVLEIDKMEAISYLRDIVKLYNQYRNMIDDEILMFVKS
ncbi:glycosyltransferase [Jeotgalicoccus meleagridis]|uniref:Glycosyltransferase 2-like domain-containing protein n=1 Tax=Jeotgalicoccus meleagridis TaxID=2759181 RepID=A0A6V7RMN9_9STAP|nr:glycosyltransferase [Jeotgalicoccus meleagridis]CAD2078904.1 hypothetical protein JEODO184_01523 [Jeotgalicoccus meleagridis]